MIRWVRSVVRCGLLMATALTGVAAQGPSIVRLDDGLFVVGTAGGNVGVRVTSEGLVVIADEYQRSSMDITEGLRRVSEEPVHFVLLTHAHGERAGGGDAIDAAVVLAHRNTRDRVALRDQGARAPAAFANDTTVLVGGVEVRAMHLGAGHTDGDAVIYFPDLKVVHAGDLLHEVAPLIDYANGGSSRGWVSALDRLLALDFETAIPGHGSVMDRREVMAFRDQMIAVRARMAELIRAGALRRDVGRGIISPELSWTLNPRGLFISRSMAGLYNEIAAEVRPR